MPESIRGFLKNLKENLKAESLKGNLASAVRLERTAGDSGIL